MNTIEDVIENLRKLPHYLGSLDKYPTKATNAADIVNQDTKGAKFLGKHYKGEKDGLYIAFHKPDIADENQVMLSKDKILDKFLILLLIHLYSGEGNTLDRVSKMRASKGSVDCNPIVFWRHDNNINFEDIIVLSFATGLDGKERENQFETPIHTYCEENRADGKRFALAEYSASNGENGTKAYTIENEIMSWANMDFAEGNMKYAKLQETLKTSLGVFYANNSSKIASGDISFNSSQLST